MYQRILVAIHTSEIVQPIFSQALGLAKLTTAKLKLLNVLTMDEASSPSLPVMTNLYSPMPGEPDLALYQEDWKLYEHRGLELLQAHTQEAIAAGVSVESDQVYGSAGPNICQAAKDWWADLIVIGHRNHSAFDEIVFGSVSNYVFHHAPCSILAVHLSQNQH